MENEIFIINDFVNILFVDSLYKQYIDHNIILLHEFLNLEIMGFVMI